MAQHDTQIVPLVSTVLPGCLQGHDRLRVWGVGTVQRCQRGWPRRWRGEVPGGRQDRGELVRADATTIGRILGDIDKCQYDDTRTIRVIPAPEGTGFRDVARAEFAGYGEDKHSSSRFAAASR